jgi:hypothetical protein
LRAGATLIISYFTPEFLGWLDAWYGDTKSKKINKS